MNFAEKIKRQTDRILRQQKLDPTQGITVTGSPSGGGIVVNPATDLAKHKTSADHDGRYYTEAEADSKFALKTIVPEIVRQEFAVANTVVVEHSLGAYPVIQVIGKTTLAYGAGLYGIGSYGGTSPVTVLKPDSITHDSVNQATVTLSSNYTGEVICIG